MSKSKESFSKKEVRNKQLKKRKEKKERRDEKKENGKQSFEEMIAYVDEMGVISSTPVDLSQKRKVAPESIELDISKRNSRDKEDSLNFGIVSKFDNSKGYGFIIDSKSRDSVFFHISDCIDEISKGNTVEYNIEQGANGFKAKNVKIKIS